MRRIVAVARAWLLPVFAFLAYRALFRFVRRASA